MQKFDKIYIAGHTGMVGSALHRLLVKQGYENIVVCKSVDLDLRNQQSVQRFFETEKPDYVFVAAAKVGGILANNTYRAEFIYDNLAIQSNVIHQSYVNGAKKLLFFGSSCIYPKYAEQPLKEDYLLTGLLEPTNEPYAIAKIAGLKMCDAYRAQYGCNFISVMPTNLYGPNDNYDANKSHVLAALLRKFHDAKMNSLHEVTLWGSGTPRREFMHVDDVADACIFLMLNYDEPGFVNVGSGRDILISELAILVKDIVGFKGNIAWDATKPDGTARKLLDISKLSNMGWRPKYEFIDGVRSVYQEAFLARTETLRH